MAGEMTVLLCLLVSFSLLRNGFRLPIPDVELEVDMVGMGMVTLLRAGATVLWVRKSELCACGGAPENEFDAAVSAGGVGSSRIVGIGLGARCG